MTLIQALLARGCQVTALVNGFDDGLSTGLIRRIVPEMLGPSDFRKLAEKFGRRKLNADRSMLGDTLDYMREQCGDAECPACKVLQDRALRSVPYCLTEHMAVGNVVIAHDFLLTRDFNLTVERFAARTECHGHLQIISVTQEPAALTAETARGGILRSEEQIVNAVDEKVTKIFLTPRMFVSSRAVQAIHESDLYLYAPGTFPSSVWPSVEVCKFSLRHGAPMLRPHILLTNSQQDGGMCGWKMSDYLYHFAGMGMSGLRIFHDSRSPVEDDFERYGGILRGSRIYTGRFLDEKCAYHDGDFVVDFLDKMLQKGW